MDDGTVTLTRKEMIERLKKLGIKRVDLDTMLAIVVAFMNGEKNVALYRNRPGGTLGSPNTIVKLRRIYNEKDESKNLDFLKDEINRKIRQIDALAVDLPTPKTIAVARCEHCNKLLQKNYVGGTLYCSRCKKETTFLVENVERLVDQEYLDGERTTSLSGEEMEEHRRKRFDPFGEFRLGIIQSAEERLDDFVWGVSSLEEIGIPPQEAITILSDFKRLNITRRSAELVTTSSMILRDFKGFDRYLELLWLVILTKQFLDDLIASGDYDVQYNRVVRAAKLHARGVFENDEAIMGAAEGYLQFEPWRSSEYKNAYEESLKIYKRPRKGHAKFLKQIRAQLYDAEDLFQLVVDPVEEVEEEQIHDSPEDEARAVEEVETKPLTLSWMMDDFQAEEISDDLIEKLKGRSLGSSDEWRKAIDAARGQVAPPSEEEIASDVEEQIISRLSDLWNPRGIAAEETKGDDVARDEESEDEERRESMDQHASMFEDLIAEREEEGREDE
ncbi:hypothetical protein M1N17_00645 [Dehalococcoidia bacterium]|nr:hypothetical protein [Dehalococcoidia bacterium]